MVIKFVQVFNRDLKYFIIQAIEFETLVKGGLIQIPSGYESFDNTKARVIVLFPVEPIKVNYNKENLKSAFKKAHSLNAFSSITDSVTWQKQQRDEWE